jgi:phage gp36-like protein
VTNILSFVLILLLHLEAATAETQTHLEFEVLKDLLIEVRDPVFSAKERKEVLTFAQKRIMERLVEEIKVPEDKLKKHFKESPSHTSLLFSHFWPDLQTQFYMTLHHGTLEERWQEMKPLVKFTSFGEGIFGTMMGHLGNFSPEAEGRYYLRWHKDKTKESKSFEYFAYPYFLHSKDLSTLLKTESHIPYIELIEKNVQADFQQKTSKLPIKKKQELAEKIILVKKIHLRAIANSAKTIASLENLRSAQDQTKIEERVTAFVDKFCINCSKKEKSEYISGAINYLQSIGKHSSSNSMEILTAELCKTLKKSGYIWNIDKLKPTPLEVLLDQRKLLNFYTLHKLKDKNKEALARAILDHEFGTLFLTNSINVLDKTEEPVGTKLACLDETADSDQSHVQKSITEAITHVEAYIERLNKLMTASPYSLTNTSEIVDYFVQTNQAATVEAITTYPQGIGWVLKSIAELEQNVARRKKLDAVVSWGGAIIGVGLTLTGLGAPEGVAILLSTAGVLKGLSAGTYYAVRASQEKSFAKELRLARAGSALITEENLKFHYRNYKTLKVTYMREFVCTAASFIYLHRLAVKQTSGDLAKSHEVLKKVLTTAKDEVKPGAIDFLKAKIIEQSLLN